MKIAVTGASGHLGNVLCRLLIKNGYKVRAFYNSDKKALLDLDLELVQGDLLSQNDIEKLVKDCDVVFHSAAKISIDGDLDGKVYDTNVFGTQNVLNACKKMKVSKIIHVSSTHVAQESPQDKPLTENRPYKTSKSYAYEYTKSLGEQIMLSAFNEGEINGCVVRPSSITGPYDYKPSEFGKALMDFKNKKIPILPPGGYDFVDVRDVAEAMINAIKAGTNGEVYHLTGKYYTIKEIAMEVNRATGIKVPKTSLPYWFMVSILPFIKLKSKITKSKALFTIESISTLKNGHQNIDNSKAINDLKLHWRPVMETIKDFYAWKNDEL